MAESHAMLLLMFGYAYAGGAHGNYNTTYRPLDLQHYKVLELADILTIDCMKQLRPLLEKSFRQNHHQKPTRH